MSSLTDPQIVNIGNHGRPSPKPNQNGTSVANKIPAYKLKEQDASSLVEIALSLVSDVDGYLDSIDQTGLTNRRMATIKDEERIGTPVKLKSPKKSKTKSPTSAEKQPLTVPRQVLIFQFELFHFRYRIPPSCGIPLIVAPPLFWDLETFYAMNSLFSLLKDHNFIFI